MRRLVLAILLPVIVSTERSTTTTTSFDGWPVTTEYCETERLNITCPPGHLIYLTSARYGRMRIGRCVRINYGNVGCSMDVLRFMDSRCSGRSSCSLDVPDPFVEQMRACPSDLTRYLEVGHTCLKVTQPEGSYTCSQTHPIIVEPQAVGYISSTLAEEPYYYGTSRCPWIISAHPGQRLNITLLSFIQDGRDGTRAGTQRYPVERDGDFPSSNGLKYGRSGAHICFEVATITDGEKVKPVEVCKDTERETFVLSSETHIIQVEINQPKLTDFSGVFLLKYEVTGCRDIPGPGGSSVQRFGDHLRVHCSATEESWFVVCKNSRWMGQLPANCDTNAAFTASTSARITGSTAPTSSGAQQPQSVLRGVAKSLLELWRRK